MGKIDIDQLSEGMILSAPVKDLRGRILLGEGSPLTVSSIRILKMWGVDEVEIVDAGGDGQGSRPVSDLDQRLLDEATAEASLLFRHTDQSLDVVKELLKISILRIAKSKSRGQADANEPA